MSESKTSDTFGAVPHGETRVKGSLTFKTTTYFMGQRHHTIVTKTGTFTFGACVQMRAKGCRKWTYVCEREDALEFWRA